MKTDGNIRRPTGRKVRLPLERKKDLGSTMAPWTQ